MVWSLKEMSPVKSLAFEYLVPSWWYCLGDLRGVGLPGGSMPLRVSLEVSRLAPFPVFSQLLAWGWRCELSAAVPAALPAARCPLPACPPTRCPLPCSPHHAGGDELQPSGTVSPRQPSFCKVASVMTFYHGIRKETKTQQILWVVFFWNKLHLVWYIIPLINSFELLLL